MQVKTKTILLDVREIVSKKTSETWSVFNLLLDGNAVKFFVQKKNVGDLYNSPIVQNFFKGSGVVSCTAEIDVGFSEKGVRAFLVSLS